MFLHPTEYPHCSCDPISSHRGTVLTPISKKYFSASSRTLYGWNHRVHINFSWQYHYLWQLQDESLLVFSFPCLVYSGGGLVAKSCQTLVDHCINVPNMNIHFLVDIQFLSPPSLQSSRFRAITKKKDVKHFFIYIGGWICTHSCIFIKYISCIFNILYIFSPSENLRLQGRCMFNLHYSESLSRVWLFVAPWTIQSVEFSRPEYWSG